MSKLDRYGCKGQVLEWLGDYLKNEKQYIYFKDCASCKAIIQYGVPQGSILGPLFLIYVDDLAAVSGDAFTILLADDTSLVMSNKNFDSLMSEAERGLKEFSNWFKMNNLSLNVI